MRNFKMGVTLEIIKGTFMPFTQKLNQIPRHD